MYSELAIEMDSRSKREQKMIYRTKGTWTI